jgi:hypothetical protein
MVKWKKLEKEALASFMLQCHSHIEKEDVKKFQFASFGDDYFANEKREALLIAHEDTKDSLEAITDRIENDGFKWVDSSSMDECMRKYGIPKGAFLAYKQGKSLVTYCAMHS